MDVKNKIRYLVFILVLALTLYPPVHYVYYESGILNVFEQGHAFVFIMHGNMEVNGRKLFVQVDYFKYIYYIGSILILYGISVLKNKKS